MVLHFHVKGKSALWSHLLAFQRECEEVEEVAPTYSQDTNSLSPLAGNDGTAPSSILGQCCLKPRVNGRNIVGQQLPTLVDVTCCVRFHTVLHVVRCCCAQFKTGQTFQPTTPNISFVP